MLYTKAIFLAVYLQIKYFIHIFSITKLQLCKNKQNMHCFIHLCNIFVKYSIKMKKIMHKIILQYKKQGVYYLYKYTNKKLRTKKESK